MAVPLTLEQLVKDADDNFVTGRQLDAAQGFGYIAEKLARDGNTIDALYFYYRSILSYKNGDDDRQLVGKLRSLALISLQNAIKLNMKLIQEINDPVEKEDILYSTIDMFSYLADEQSRMKMVNSLFSLYKTIFSSPIELSFDRKEQLLNRYMQLAANSYNIAELNKARKVYVNTIYQEYSSITPLNGTIEIITIKEELKNLLEKINDKETEDEKKKIQSKIKLLQQELKAREVDVAQVFRAANRLIEAASICLELEDLESFENCITVLMGLNLTEDELMDFRWKEFGLIPIISEQELVDYKNKFLLSDDEFYEMTEPKRIIIDGRSLLTEGIADDQKLPGKRFQHLLNELDREDSKWKEMEKTVIIDQNIVKALDNPNIVGYLEELEVLINIPNGVSLDQFLVKFAKDTHGILLTNRNIPKIKQTKFVIDNVDKNKVRLLDFP